MNLDEIFRYQSDLGMTKFWYVIVENGKLHCRNHEAYELESLASLLKGYKYTGVHSLPRFV